jgi:hypothetical protein
MSEVCLSHANHPDREEVYGYAGEVFLMTDENVEHTKEYSPKRAAHGAGEYDPFDRGRFPVGVRTIQGLDTVRGRQFPCDIWYPAAAQFCAWIDAVPFGCDIEETRGSAAVLGR